jgi:uncharacterized membrane protein
MNEMLVAVFGTEDAATKGMRTLNELHDEGGISLYGSALIVKDRDGRISVKQHSGEAPLGTGLGLMMGGSLESSEAPSAPQSGLRLGAILAFWRIGSAMASI